MTVHVNSARHDNQSRTIHDLRRAKTRISDRWNYFSIRYPEVHDLAIDAIEWIVDLTTFNFQYKI